MTLNVQLLSMIIMVAGGVYLGFAFDTYSRLTRKLRRNPLFNYVLVMAFWLLQTGALFYVLFRVNEGILRVYVFFACLLGYSIYAVIFRRGYQYVLEKCIHVVKMVFNWIVQAVSVLLIQPILWLLHVLYSLIKGLVIFIATCLSYPFRWLFILLKWMLPEAFSKKAFQLYGSCSIIVRKYMVIAKKIFRKWR